MNSQKQTQKQTQKKSSKIVEPIPTDETEMTQDDSRSSTPEKDKKVALTQVEFMNKVKLIAADVDRLLEINKKVLTNGSCELGDKVYRSRDVKAMTTAVKAAIISTGVDYKKKNASRKKKVVAVEVDDNGVAKKKKNTEFNKSIVLSQNYVNFFTDDSKILGFCDPDDKKSGFLSDEMSIFTEKNIATQAYATNLSYLYFFKYKMQHEDNRQFVSANARMLKYFKKEFETIKEKDPSFDTGRFRMATFQKVTAANHVRVEDLEEDDVVNLKDENIGELLVEEMAKVVKTKNFIKAPLDEAHTLKVAAKKKEAKEVNKKPEETKEEAQSDNEE